MDQAARGTAALNASNYADAIDEFTAALALHPESPDYYIKRATAYQRSTPPQLELALRDAELAVVFGRKRAKYELVTQAQLRRAITLFHLGRYADAGFVLAIVRRRDAKEKSLEVWERKVQGKLGALAEGEEAAKVRVQEVPVVEVPSRESVVVKKKEEEEEKSEEVVEGKTQVRAAVQQTHPSQIKQDWYQSNESVTVTLLAKGVPKGKISVDIQEHSLSISFPTIASSTYDYSLDPLFAAVDPAKSSYKVLSTKIEVVLKKSVAGKWKTLEGDADSAPASKPESASVESEAVKKAALSTSTTASTPAYPTSSRTGPKNWDKVVLDEQADDDEDNQDPNFFFKQLYKGADEDTKRAMMKSYVESNGTALSTNWGDVGKGPVVTHPPEGMVAKKWNE